MKKAFLLRLLLLLFVALGVTGVVTFVYVTRQAEQQSAALMRARLSDLAELLRYSDRNIERVAAVNQDLSLSRVRAAAEIIRLDPALLRDQDALQGLCNKLGATQLSVSDENGVMVAAVPVSNVGFVLGEHTQSREFEPCISQPDFELCQRVSSSGEEHLPMQYAGVHRLDAPGCVQLGFAPQQELLMRDAADFAKLSTNFRVGRHGLVLGFRQGRLLNRLDVPVEESALLALPLDEASRLAVGEAQYFTFALQVGEYRLVALLPEADLYYSRWQVMCSLLGSNAVLILVMLAVVCALLHYMVLRHLTALDTSLRRITGGDLDERVEMKAAPELMRLASGVNQMVDALQIYGEQERERVNRELMLAREIQMSTMPSRFPAFPGREEFDVYAISLAARTVGGEFYDYFEVDEDHLVLVQGCAVGKGIPAALSMMRCVAVIRQMARSLKPLRDQLAEINRVALETNNSRMRFSLLLGRLEVSSGCFSCVNAGHGQPLICHEGGQFAELQMPQGPQVGVRAEADFPEKTFRLQSGDRLFLYSPGVLSAEDHECSRFGLERLLETLDASRGAIYDLPARVRGAVRRFVGCERQQQDMTMLAFEYQGEKRKWASVMVQAGKPKGVSEMLQRCMEAVLAAPLQIEALQQDVLAILRVLSPQREATVTVTCTETQVEIRVRYGGVAFNALTRVRGVLPKGALYSGVTGDNLIVITQDLV